jgi:hypothetical protein
MAPPTARSWSWLAAVVGLLLVVAHLAVRATSGFGWVAVFQMIAVAPWLVLPVVPLALHVTRRAVVVDRATRVLVILGSAAFAASALTIDVDDVGGECFLGACRGSGGPDPWWQGLPLIDATPFLSIALSWVALCLLIAAMLQARSWRARTTAATTPGDGSLSLEPPPPPRGQTQSVPGTPTGMAMVEPEPAASEADR